MGDFLLDFRPVPERRLSQAAQQLRFMDYTRSVIFDEPEFGLVITFTEQLEFWAPHRSADGTLVAVAGRVALDESAWKRAETVPGPGGMAGKAVHQIYRERGLEGLESIGGNCVLFVYDPSASLFHIVTDCVGAFPAFRFDSSEKLVFASHPDVLAAAAGEQKNLDEESIAEFLLTSTVTPPYTYYRRIRAVQHGAVTTIQFGAHGPRLLESRRYFDFSFKPDATLTEDDLAEELAVALRKAVRRRTLPRFGRTAVALSGGLDSRVILACVENKEQTFAFSCYNESNRELAVAEAIAHSLQVPFFAWQRPFEYYGDTAEMGIRISGGMGTFANNHFLGMVERLRREGAQNLLTGCYCDYLFKGLPLNCRKNWLTGREELGPFKHEFYFNHHLSSSALAAKIQGRLESRVPAKYRAQESDAAVFEVESRRTFPFFSEGDNQQRLVPQRVTGWYLPMADRDILEVYRKIPWHYKLNRSIYSKAVRKLCSGPLARIPDANTGVRPGASALTETLSTNLIRLRRKLKHQKKSISTDGSWPDWQYYVRHSAKLRSLWKQPNPQATDMFHRLLGAEAVRPDTADYLNGEVFLLVPMLSFKLWLEQWHG